MKISIPLILTATVFLAACGKKNDMGTTPPPAGPVASSVITWAGSGTAGSADGTKVQASFNSPTGISLNGDGFLFVADRQNDLIRIISPAGVVNTIAGTALITGHSDTAGKVTFTFPAGVATSSAGNVFVADQGNAVIREISTAGVTSTFAGSGTSGYFDDIGLAARFSTPTGIATDKAGNIYVADNNRIRKISATGIVTTLAGGGGRGAGDGTGTAALFNQPSALVVDGSGNVYVADQGNNMIRKITSAGVVTTLAGTITAGAANGVGTAASFSGPAGICIDGSGNLFVGDSNNNLIRKIAPDGTVTTFAGTGVAGGINSTPLASTFNSPQGVAVDQFGRVFVADTGNSEIRLITIQ